MAEDDDQPKIANNFKYEWRPGYDMEEHDYDEEDLEEEEIMDLDEFQQDEQAPELHTREATINLNSHINDYNSTLLNLIINLPQY